jgi:hypothetical protein
MPQGLQPPPSRLVSPAKPKRRPFGLHHRDQIEIYIFRKNESLIQVGKMLEIYSMHTILVHHDALWYSYLVALEKRDLQFF